VNDFGVNELGVNELGVCQPWCVSTLVCVNLGVNLCLNTVLVWDRSTFCLNTFV
jgi:hypothetical protein